MTAIDLDDFIVWVTLGIILGGRTGDVLFYNPQYFAAHPFEAFELWKGGMSFHGGFLGCVAAVAAFSWKRDIPFLPLGDITCAVAPIGLLLGRIANFVNGELWGRTTDVPWGVIFPGAGDLPRHPSQLYEATLEGVLLFIALFILARRESIRSKVGTLSGAFLIGYAIARMIGEQFREPEVELSTAITWGQWLSVPMLAFGVFLIWRAKPVPPRPASSPSPR